VDLPFAVVDEAVVVSTEDAAGNTGFCRATVAVPLNTKG